MFLKEMVKKLASFAFAPGSFLKRSKKLKFRVEHYYNNETRRFSRKFVVND